MANLPADIRAELNAEKVEKAKESGTSTPAEANNASSAGADGSAPGSMGPPQAADANPDQAGPNYAFIVS